MFVSRHLFGYIRGGFGALWSSSSVRVSRRRYFSSSSLSSSSSSSLPVSSKTTSSLSSSQRWRCYRQLSKARLSALVAASASAGCLAAGSPVSLSALAAVTSGTFLTAACANTFNQVIEVKSDALMKRTRLRPLPSRRMTRSSAAAFGVSSGAIGLAMLYAGTNSITASLALANIFLYTCVYTPLKKVTPLNTEVGSIVGAIPPVMGWVAATGTLAGGAPIALASILFLWQMPHFLSLAHLLRYDYISGGYRMLSHLDPTGCKTSTSSLAYTSVLSVVPLITTAVGMTSVMFAIDGTAANAYLLLKAYQFRAHPTDASARELFKASLWHLPLILTLFAFHKVNDEAHAALDVPVLHDIGRSLCPHESLAQANSASTSRYCPNSYDLDVDVEATATQAALAVQNCSSAQKSSNES